MLDAVTNGKRSDAIGPPKDTRSGEASTARLYHLLDEQTP